LIYLVEAAAGLILSVQPCLAAQQSGRVGGIPRALGFVLPGRRGGFVLVSQER